MQSLVNQKRKRKRQASNQRVSDQLEAASTFEQHAQPVMWARSHNVSDFRATRTDND